VLFRSLSRATHQWPSNERLQKRLGEISENLQARETKALFDELLRRLQEASFKTLDDSDALKYVQAALKKSQEAQLVCGDDDELKDKLSESVESILEGLNKELTDSAEVNAQCWQDVVNEVLLLYQDDERAAQLQRQLRVATVARKGLGNVKAYYVLGADAPARAKKALDNGLAEVMAMISTRDELEMLTEKEAPGAYGWLATTAQKQQHTAVEEATQHVLKGQGEQLQEAAATREALAKGGEGGKPWHDGSVQGLDAALAAIASTIGKLSAATYAEHVDALSTVLQGWHSTYAKLGIQPCKALQGRAEAVLQSLRASRCEGLLAALMRSFAQEKEPTQEVRKQLKKNCYGVRKELEKAHPQAWGCVQPDIRERAEDAAKLR